MKTRNPLVLSLILVALVAPASAQRYLVTSRTPAELNILDLQAGVILEEPFADLGGLGIDDPFDSALVGTEVWLAARNGIFRFDQASQTLIGSIPATPQTQARGIHAVSDGAWVAQVSQLIKYDLAGNQVAAWVAPSGTDVFDVLGAGGELLVGASVGALPAILRFDLAGIPLGPFLDQASLPLGSGSLDSGQLSIRPSTQTYLLADGGRVFEVDAQGLVIETYNPGVLESAALELRDGRILVADLDGLRIMYPSFPDDFGSLIPFYDGEWSSFTYYDSGSPNYLRICPGVVHSGGEAARLNVLGGASLADGSLVMDATGGPAGEFSIVLYGQAGPPQPFGGGTLCIAPGGLGILRTQSVQAFNSFGVRFMDPIEFGQDFDPQAPITFGSTWAFQLAYRDGGSGIGAFNASDALTVTIF